jgi:hypothetical protein
MSRRVAFSSKRMLLVVLAGLLLVSSGVVPVAQPPPPTAKGLTVDENAWLALDVNTSVGIGLKPIACINTKLHVLESGTGTCPPVYVAVFGESDRTGVYGLGKAHFGVIGHSFDDTGVVAISENGTNIIEGWDKLGGTLRFRVERASGLVEARGAGHFGFDGNNYLHVGWDSANYIIEGFGPAYSPILINFHTQKPVHVWGDFEVRGGHTKALVQDHPADPTKEIVYVSLEGPEAGTYIRGTARLINGEAVINLPEHFSLITSEEGLTVQLTPWGECNGLYVAERSTSRIVVKELRGGTSNVKFDYLVQGVRKGHEDHQVIRDK